ncbi:hypothetical protein DW322_18140 [Rhodococcus rhodnii]|uniref:Alcohol dehydrogenase-like N-terminal domain-containing protein n=2 Tax=Rhodococcus rhodnii TaxID=38312 RepID=A0A6P2CKR6_9NOCA|nr:hypothetical protein DW322_18140 [Rhodococcus rhodnii]
MRAVQFATFGGPEVLAPVALPRPEPGPGQVRVLVAVAGVNAVDGKLRSGAMEQIMPLALPHVPGSEVAGVVTAVGDGAEAEVGDAVFGWADTGGYAEQALMSTWLAN